MINTVLMDIAPKLWWWKAFGYLDIIHYYLRFLTFFLLLFFGLKNIEHFRGLTFLEIFKFLNKTFKLKIEFFKNLKVTPNAKLCWNILTWRIKRFPRERKGRERESDWVKACCRLFLSHFLSHSDFIQANVWKWEEGKNKTKNSIYKQKKCLKIASDKK